MTYSGIGENAGLGAQVILDIIGTVHNAILDDCI